MKVNVIYNVTGRTKNMKKVFADILVKLNKVRIVDDSVFAAAPVVSILEPEPTPSPTPDPVAELTPAVNIENADLFKNADIGANEKPKESVVTKPRANNPKSKSSEPEA